MAIFSRVADILKANINDLLDKAEDPEKMVKQIIIEMEEQLGEATRALGQVMGSERMALKELNAAKASSAEWENKAKVSLKAGNPDLARRALEQKVAIDKSIASLQESYDSLSKQVNDMRAQVNTLRTKLDEAKAKQNVLIARAKVADAKKDVAVAVNSIDTDSVFSKLDKMEEKIMSKEAEADAFADLGEATIQDGDEYAELEKDDAVEAEMARLMKELNL